MKIKRTILAPMVVALSALATGGWFLQRGVDQERNVYANSRLFNEVLRAVSHGFVEEKNEDELYQMAIDGMLQELGDPHTGFLPAKEYEDLRITTQGEYGGLGVSIDRRAGWITVISPLPGTPGERAGLRSGDQIIEVNGESTKGWTSDQAVAKLRGPKGTPVDIKVARIGADEPIPFRIVRDEIHIRSVPAAYMIDKDVGYVELTVFSESSTEELRAAVDKLRTQGAKGIVLDMRANSGGLLDQGVAVTDLFLPDDQLVVETRGRLPNANEKYMTVDAASYEGMPVVVLVSERSASATEIVAGALQDHDRALVLGRTTFGKGSVQTVYPLSNNNWLKLTTGKWFTPVGRSIQRPFGDEHPLEEIAEPGTGGAAAAGEEEKEDKPTYKTDGGRVVYGGGGITPDLVISPDTLSADERLFLSAVQDSWTKYLETRFAFSVRYNKENPNLQPGFTVTPQMLDQFHAALQQAGIDIERPVFDGARRWIEIQLGYEITYGKWGVLEARRRENTRDPQVLAAVDLLKRSPDPQSLFAAAAAHPAAKTASARGSEN